MKRWISFIFVLCLMVSLPAGAFAKTPFYEDSNAIAQAAESVLMLTCYDNSGNAVATGSGFLAFEDGIIVTNYHVINGQIGAIKANTEDGMYFDINEILCYDQVADVAILKTNAKTRLDLLKLASTSTLGKGSRVVAIGSPLGLLNTVSEGIYSGIIQDKTEYILFTAAISSGSSGGALFNEDGEVIGVTAATYTEGQNLNLAVPVENVIKLWDLYKSGNYVETPPKEEVVPISPVGPVSYIISHKNELKSQLVQTTGYYYPNKPDIGFYLLSSKSEVHTLEKLMEEYDETFKKSITSFGVEKMKLQRNADKIMKEYNEMLKSKAVVVFIKDTYKDAYSIKQGDCITVQGILEENTLGTIYIGSAWENAVIIG